MPLRTLHKCKIYVSTVNAQTRNDCIEIARSLCDEDIRVHVPLTTYFREGQNEPLIMMEVTGAVGVSRQSVLQTITTIGLELRPPVEFNNDAQYWTRQRVEIPAMFQGNVLDVSDEEIQSPRQRPAAITNFITPTPNRRAPLGNVPSEPRPAQNTVPRVRNYCYAFRDRGFCSRGENCTFMHTRGVTR